MKSSFTKELTSAGSYWTINKNLTRYLTLVDVAVLMEHIYQYDRKCHQLDLNPSEYNPNVRYLCPKEFLAAKFMVSRDTIRRVEDKLVALNFIDKNEYRNSIGRVNKFDINVINIRECYTNPDKYFFSDGYSSILGEQRIKQIQDSNSKKDYIAVNNTFDETPDHGLICVVNQMQNQPTIINTPITGVADAPPLTDLRSVTVPSERELSRESRRSIIASSVTPIEQSIQKTPCIVEQTVQRPRSDYKVPKKKPDISPTAAKRLLLPETLAVIAMWNEHPNLKQQNLVYSTRGTCRYAQQHKYIQRLDNYLPKIMDGTFYDERPDMDQLNVKKVHFTLAHMKMAIERFNRMATLEYTKNPEPFQNFNLNTFFFNNLGVIFGQKEGQPLSKERFMYRYTFIHCMLQDPLPQSERYNKVNTNHPMIVNGVIEMLKSHSGYKHNVGNYASVVRCVGRAVDAVKGAANGKSDRILQMLPRHLSRCMGNKIHIDKLYNAIEFRLLPYLREIRELS